MCGHLRKAAVIIACKVAHNSSQKNCKTSYFSARKAEVSFGLQSDQDFANDVVLLAELLEFLVPALEMMATHKKITACYDLHGTPTTTFNRQTCEDMVGSTLDQGQHPAPVHIYTMRT